MKYASCMWRTLVNMAHSSLAFPGFRNWTSYSWLCILWYPHRIRIISLMRLGTVCNGQTIGEPLLFVDSEKIPRFYGVPIYIDAHWVWGFPSHVRITHQKPTLNPHVDPFFIPSMFQWYSHNIPILIHYPMIFAMSPMIFPWKTQFLFSSSGCLEELVPATLCGQASRGEAGDVNHEEISLGFMVDISN
jgi:hypothetical protein